MINDDNNNIDKIQYGLKNIIFDLLYYVINLDGYSIALYFILIIIESYQCFYWYFYGDLQRLWKIQEWSQAFEDFFGFFMIVPYQASSGSYSTMISMMYGIFALVVILILFMTYIGYKLKKGNQGLNGPLQIIKIIFEILNPVLFMPFFDLFLSVFRCLPSEVDEVYYHKIFKEEKCYQGNNLLHVFFGGIGAIILLALSYLVTITYFESRYRNNVVLLKVTGRNDVKLLLFKAIIVTSTTFLDQNLIILNIFFMFLSQMVIFLDVNKSSNYLHYVYSKLLSIQAAILFWTTLMLVFGQIVYDTDYQGIPYIWIFGIPFISAVVILRKEYRYDLLMVDSNKFDSLNQAIFQILYLTEMLNYYNKDKNIGAILDAFVDYHKTICKRDDCPCVPKNMNQKKIKRFIKNLKIDKNQSPITNQYVILVYIIERVFVLALSRFPGCIQLRINHALFLLDKMKSTQQALQELSLAENEKPYIDEQFQIYRYKKTIEEEMLETRKNTSNNQEGVNEITTDSHIKEIYRNIEKSTNHHMEFWSQLSEETPDLAKIYEIGIKLNYSSYILQENWKKMIKMNIDTAPNLMRTYAKYLLDVLHDKEQANSVIVKMKQAQALNTDRAKTISNVNDFPNESTGLIAISGEDNQLSRVTGLNMTCSSLFQYSKTELINRKVNILMPQMYSDSHDSILEDYLHTLESNFLNRDKLVMGKGKNGYLVPNTIYIRYVPSFVQETQFFASFKQDKYFKVLAFVLVDSKTLEITNVTSNCMNLFGITNNSIVKKKPKITDLVPDFFANLNDFTQKGGFTQKIEYHVKDSQKQEQNFNIQVFPQAIPVRSKTIKGYIVRLEKSLQVTSNQSNIEYQSMDELEKQNNSMEEQNSITDRYSHIQKSLFNNPAFTFSLDFQSLQFTGQFIVNVNLDDGHILTQLNDKLVENTKYIIEPVSVTNLEDIDDQEDLDANQDEQNVSIEQIDLGLGIRTMRYNNGQFIDIEDIKQAEFTEEDEDEEEIQKRQNEINALGADDQRNGEIEFNDKSNIFKSRTKFIAFLDKSESFYTNYLSLFRWLGLVLLLLMGSLALWSYFTQSNTFDEINHDYNLVKLSTQRQDKVQRILFQLTNFRLQNMQILSEENNLSTQQSVKDTVQELELIQVELQDAMDKDIVGEAQIQLLTENIVTIRIQEANGDKKEQKVDLNQATSQIIEKSFELANQDLSQYTDQNTDLFFVEYQLLNNYYSSLVNSSNLYVESLTERQESESSSIFMIASIIILLLFAVLIWPIFAYVSRNQEEVLKLFLEIPLIRVKRLFSKAESYSNQLQMGEDESISDQEDNELEDEENEVGIGRRRKTRKYKYESIEKRTFFIKLVLVILFLEAYFLSNFFLSEQMRNNMSALVKEMNVTTQAQPYYTFCNNVLRKAFIDLDFDINSGDKDATIDQILKTIYDINSEIQSEHSFNIQYHSQDYQDYFQDLMEKDSCKQISKLNNTSVSESQCSSFSHGIFTEGLAPALTKLFENMRYMITIYQEFRDEQLTVFPEPGSLNQNPIGIEQDSRLIYIANILNITQARDINNMQDNYFRGFFQEIVERFQQSIEDSLNSNTTTRITLFVCFILLLIFIYIFFWIPLVSKLSREIKRSTNMLGIIPLVTIQQTKTIKEYIKKQLKLE